MHNSVVVFEHIDFINVWQTLKSKLAELFVESSVVIGVLLWRYLLRSPNSAFAASTGGVTESLLQLLSSGQYSRVVHVDICLINNIPLISKFESCNGSRRLHTT